MDKLTGTVFKVRDNINTDYIIPAKYLDLYEPEDLAVHAFEGLDERYPEIVRDSTFVVAGENFGLGSAREQAPNALKGAGVKCIIAKSFARIFFRNTLNIGIPAIECFEAAQEIGHGETIEVNLEKGIILARTETFNFRPFPSHIMEILLAGGLVSLLKNKLT